MTGPETVGDTVPDDDDLVNWKAADFRVSERVAEAAAARVMASAKVWHRYFGQPQQTTRLHPEEYGMMKSIAFLEWYAYRYRGTPRSKTVAERLLQGALPASDRAVLEARAAATPSVYRVAGIARGASLDVVDVLSSRECQLTDKSLSMSAIEGMGLVARVYPVGSFHFLSIAGPALAVIDADKALTFLEEQVGLRVDESVDAKVEHLLGRLWAWSEDHTGIDKIELRNQDGHALRWHSASFGVQDPTTLANALAQRDDIDSREDGVEWGWIGGTGGDLHLATLTLYGDELLVEVNSKERFEAARELLEAVPGVTFRSVTEKNVDPRVHDDRALDDRLPGNEKHEEPSAEVLAAVQQMIRKKCFEWLDEEIPALGHQTPRSACKTADGRRRVARLIRTYPDPGGIPGVVIPRQEMLERIGLAKGRAEEE